jgi:hypothetical protein
MFAVVFLFLAFGVLITFLVVLAMFLEEAFFPKLPLVRQKGTNEAKEQFTERQQAAVSGSTQPIVRTTLVKAKHFKSKRTSGRLWPRPHG